jgi:SNF2 family DNA or RNA helicase
MMRRMRADVLPDLPEKSYRTLIVDDIDAATRNICDETVRLLAEAGVELTSTTEATDLRNNPLAFGVISAARTALAAAKIPFLIKTIEEYEAAGEPVVVFADHRAPIDVLAARPGWASITGDVKIQDRSEIARGFREGEFKGIALTVGAGGTGLTLCGGTARAAHLIFVSRPWDPSSADQCEDRLCRIGQDRGVLVTDLIADHLVDRRLWEIVTRKRSLIDATLADEKYSTQSGGQT